MYGRRILPPVIFKCIPYHAKIAALDIGNFLLHPTVRQEELIGVVGSDDPSTNGLQVKQL
jgi:hypothetical protein